MADKVQETASEYGMKINIKKTKVMKTSKRPGQEFAVFLEGQQLSQVTHFSYLGSLITQDRHCKKDIRWRIARAKNAFSNRKELLTKSFTLDLKKRIVKTVIWSTLLYGAESWALRKDDIRRLESCEMWLWRKILNISWTEKVSNDEVLRRDNEDKAIIPSINKRQRTWLGKTLGHTLRHGNLTPSCN